MSHGAARSGHSLVLGQRLQPLPGPGAARGPSNSPQSQDHAPTHRSVSNLLAAACSCCFPLKRGTGRQGGVSPSCGVSALHTPSSSSSQQMRNPRSRRVPKCPRGLSAGQPRLGTCSPVPSPELLLPHPSACRAQREHRRAEGPGEQTGVDGGLVPGASGSQTPLWRQCRKRKGSRSDQILSR